MKNTVKPQDLTTLSVNDCLTPVCSQLISKNVVLRSLKVKMWELKSKQTLFLFPVLYQKSLFGPGNKNVRLAESKQKQGSKNLHSKLSQKVTTLTEKNLELVKV